MAFQPSRDLIPLIPKHFWGEYGVGFEGRLVREKVQITRQRRIALRTRRAGGGMAAVSGRRHLAMLGEIALDELLIREMSMVFVSPHESQLSALPAACGPHGIDGRAPSTR